MIQQSEESRAAQLSSPRAKETFTTETSTVTNPVKAHFAARTDNGEKRCTNCGETDTPQWRGTLCNACALWRRSRGTDRPMPLVFPSIHQVESPRGDFVPQEEEGAADDDGTRFCETCDFPTLLGQRMCARCTELTEPKDRQRRTVRCQCLVKAG